MGGGYHSRSPEEFRKFLEESRKQSGGGRFSRVRLVFILNLVLVVLVIGMVARTLNPGAFTIQSSSPKSKMESTTLYVKSSREGKDGFPTFFLFMKNENDSAEIRFPDPTWNFRILLSGKEGLNCLDTVWEVPERTLHPGKIEFDRFRLKDEAIDSLPPDCKVKSSESFLERMFRRSGSKSGLKLEVIVSHKEDRKILSIENL
ncbi:hypothetical protein [Leptospira alstonii]|uniref:Uncharacterized protein n=2 Tax=Leptospira alstonii TaxID=28452 RepID=M6D6K7_9LEPT|nr:hypothetical protein [Leptospira alstonii]EMJ94195.1 hypothetical protein LEP1GSC194_0194 [Leptospira alstonii serovar Sichuan str. 79601]EQA79277.1 hypothetical protein LEP1GSC193_2668 [Leptospira alstonii serovar Pingchang str. 80-412]